MYDTMIDDGCRECFLAGVAEECQQKRYLELVKRKVKLRSPKWGILILTDKYFTLFTGKAEMFKR